MSRTPHRAPRTVPTPPAPPSADAELPDDDEPTPADALQTLLAELGAAGGSGSVTVYRLLDKGAGKSYLFRCTPEAFALDTLRDEYGGGEFRVYVAREGGGLARNVVVRVEAPKHAAQPSPTSDAIATMMREQNERIAAALAERRSGEPAASLFKQIDVPSLLTAAGAFFTGVRALMPPPPPPVEPRGDGAAKAMDYFMRGLEFGQSVAGKGGDDDGGLLGVMRDALKSPLVGQAIASIAAPKPAQPVPRPALAQPQQPQPQQPQQPAPTQPSPQAVIAHYIGMLCKFADEGAEPGLYADLILDRAPDELLHALLAPPDPLAELAQHHPEMTATPERVQWFGELVRELRAGMDQAGEAPANGRNGAAVLQSAPSPRGAARGASEPPDAANHVAAVVPGGDSAR